MTELIPIVGTNFLSMIEERDMFMCLAHLIDEDEQYTSFYKRMAEEGKYIIMDNGACEGDLRLPTELADKCHRYGFNELIIPDVFDDGAATREMFHESYNYFRMYLPNIKLMAVTHGKTMIEHALNIVEYIKEGVDVIGIPKVVTKHLGPKARHRIAFLIRELDPRVEIHYLGAGDGFREVLNIPCECKVRSVDSALPFILAKEGKGIYCDRTERITFREEVVEVNVSLLKRNLHEWS